MPCFLLVPLFLVGFPTAITMFHTSNCMCSVKKSYFLIGKPTILTDFKMRRMITIYQEPQEVFLILQPALRFLLVSVSQIFSAPQVENGV